MNKKKKTKQANTGGVNKDCPCILFTSLSVADRQSLSHIFVQNEGCLTSLHYCIVLSVCYFKIIGKSLATVSFVTILTVNFAGENHSIAAMPDFKRRGPAKKST